MTNRYCTQCNSKLETREIQGMSLPQIVCMKCERIEPGYEKHEEALVYLLQKYFGNESLWQVNGVLSIFRYHLRIDKETKL